MKGHFQYGNAGTLSLQFLFSSSSPDVHVRRGASSVLASASNSATTDEAFRQDMPKTPYLATNVAAFQT